jgi:hypothetical protein
MTGPARREKHSPRQPWIIPTIAIVALAIVVVGIVIVAVNGWRMF